MVALLALSVGMAMGNGGVNPPEPGSVQYLQEIEKYLAIEAVCGVGTTNRLVHGPTIDSTNNISGTGLLIAPNMVLTAAHVIGTRFITDYDQLYFEYPTDDEMIDPASGDPVLSVRFRLDPFGNIGDIQVGGPSYYQVPVKRVLFSNVVFAGDPNEQGSPLEHDIAILILADTEFDPPPFNRGWIDHITPSPIAPVNLPSQHPVWGVFAGYGPVPNLDLSSPACCARGDLRYADLSSFVFTNRDDSYTNALTKMITGRYPRAIATSNPSFSRGSIANLSGLVGVGDSGSLLFLETETGQYIATGGVPSGGGPSSITDFYYSDSWDAMFSSLMNVYGYPDMLPTDALDITTSPGTGGPSYGWGNWSIDASDALAVAAGLASNSWSDWNKDDTINKNDFSAYISALESAQNSYHFRPVFPLRTGLEDIDGDGRFNVNDVIMLATLNGSDSSEYMAYDLNGNGMIDAGDISLFSFVLGKRGESPGGGQPGPLLFDHGILGDVNRDGSIDEDDISQIAAFDLAGGFNTILSSDPLYDVVYDANLDDIIENFDAQLILAVVIPGDLGVASGSPNLDMNLQRDNLVKGTEDSGSANDGPDVYRRSNAKFPIDPHSGTYGQTENAFVTINKMKTVAFDNGVAGATLTAVGDPVIYEETTQVARGAPIVTDLGAIYPAAGGNVLVYPSSVWNGIDIIPIGISSSTDMDIWFGDPTEGGFRVTLNLTGEGNQDILASDPIAGHTFKPERVFVVGDRLHAWCSDFETSTGRRSRMALLSAAMPDIRDEATDPWTLHYITNEYGVGSDRAGSMWSISKPQLLEGKYWAIGVDYTRGVGRNGGQAWILNWETDGTPNTPVLLHTFADTGIHFHGGEITYDGAEYKAFFHAGDTFARLYFRSIPSLLNYADNATTDTSSGIGGLFETKIASTTDWSAITLAAGLDEDTIINPNAHTNWSNSFILSVDPLDNSKFLYGADTGPGLITRVSMDSNDIAIAEMVFNPVSRSRANLHENTAAQQLLLFLIDSSGPYMAGQVFNVINNGTSKDEFAGIVYSDDYGATWSLAWQGSPTSGTTVSAGIAVLQSGKVLIGKVNATSSVRLITPGAKVSGRPLFVGFRNVNQVGTASEQREIPTGENGVTSSATPEKATPSYVNEIEVFNIQRDFLDPRATMEIVDLGITTAQLAENFEVIWWERKLTPTGTSEQDRVSINNTLMMSIPGADLNGSPSNASRIRTRISKVTTDTWTRLVFQYDTQWMVSNPSLDPADFRLLLAGRGGDRTSGNSEMFVEFVGTDVDRVPLPYNDPSDQGVASGKLTGLALGETWSILVVAQIPENCWDAWTAGKTGSWATGAPIFTITDSTDTDGITFQGKMDAIADGGQSVAMSTVDFNWGFFDSSRPTVTEIPAYPLRTASVIVAISKDGAGDIRYAIGSPSGIISGTRIMATAVDADILRFADIDETDALEMLIHKVQTSSRARTLSELENAVSTLELDPDDRLRKK